MQDKIATRAFLFSDVKINPTKKGSEEPFCIFCNPVGLAERQVRHSDFTNVVASVAKAASSVGQFDVTITCHE